MFKPGDTVECVEPPLSGYGRSDPWYLPIGSKWIVGVPLSTSLAVLYLIDAPLSKGYSASRFRLAKPDLSKITGNTFSFLLNNPD